MVLLCIDVLILPFVKNDNKIILAELRIRKTDFVISLLTFIYWVDKNILFYASRSHLFGWLCVGSLNMRCIFSLIFVKPIKRHA